MFYTFLNLLKHCDIAVIGAGPVGSATALALSRRGARVLLLEADPRASDRFAGEWVHPPGARVLQRLGIRDLSDDGARSGFGFVVFPEDGHGPIRLPYPAGARAIACEHHALVGALRQRAADAPGVEYLPHTRVLAVRPGHISARSSGGMALEIAADRIVGADGRRSVLRSTLGGSAAVVASYMASVELRDIELPFEGYGHVILGGPGPVMLYRIDAERIRAAIDVPLELGRRARNSAFLWDGFRNVLPAELRDSFRAALERGPLLWAATQFCPLAIYARGGLAVVGEAAGCFHPMTAAGLTQGFLDAESLAVLDDWRDYQTQREQGSYVAELLAGALYQVFSRHDPTAVSIRRSVYRLWRQSSYERDRTIRILMGHHVNRGDFAAAFLRAGIAAATHTLRRATAVGRWEALPSALGAYLEWLAWPLAGVSPARMRRSFRPVSEVAQPIPALAGLLSPRAPLHFGLSELFTPGRTEPVPAAPAPSAPAREVAA
jgi:2-polyprenyl-6-methoxyphenol hydroxylase-like FAD-dependent oxidoreductase